MSTRLLQVVTAVAVLLGLAAFNSIYVVYEYERAVKLEFGRVVQADVPPGLHFKLPIVHVVRKFDGRIVSLNSEPQSFLTSEKKGVIVDAYIKWRVEEVQTFYTSTSGDSSRANRLLEQRVNAGLRDEFAVRTVREVVSGERDQLMSALVSQLNETVGEELGVEVVDVRVKRIDLPDQVSESVYQRMRSERKRIAQELRAEGQETANVIRAGAERQRTVLLAEAYRDAEKLRGEGDAKSAQIYSEAYGMDPEFFLFQRSLKAYVENFSSKQDLLLLNPDSDYLRFLIDSEPSRQ